MNRNWIDWNESNWLNWIELTKLNWIVCYGCIRRLEWISLTKIEMMGTPKLIGQHCDSSQHGLDCEIWWATRKKMIGLIYWRDLAWHTRAVSPYTKKSGSGIGVCNGEWWRVSEVSTDLILTQLTECHRRKVIDRALAKQVEPSSWELSYPWIVSVYFFHSNC